MKTDYKALFIEMVRWIEKTSSHYYLPPDVLLRARAALTADPAVTAVPEQCDMVCPIPTAALPQQSLDHQSLDDQATP
jgi:hypothetical protein